MRPGTGKTPSRISERNSGRTSVIRAYSLLIGDMSLKVDGGLRSQKTNVVIGGLAAPLTGLVILPGDITAYAFQLAPATYTTDPNSYKYFLPSLDLNLLVLPNLK